MTLLYASRTTKHKKGWLRWENIRGVFEFHGILRGKKIVLLDDIITKDTPVEEYIYVLRKAGSVDVAVVVLAIK